jgi:hypothetical protein
MENLTRNGFTGDRLLVKEVAAPVVEFTNAGDAQGTNVRGGEVQTPTPRTKIDRPSNVSREKSSVRPSLNPAIKGGVKTPLLLFAIVWLHWRDSGL